MIWAALIFLLFIALIELTSFLALQHAFCIKRKTSVYKRFKIVFWLPSIILALSAIIYFIFLRFSSKPDYIVYRNYFKLTGLFFIFYLPKLFLIILYLAEWIIRIPFLFLRKKNNGFDFLASLRILSITGTVIALFAFILVVYGILIGRTNYQVEHVNIAFSDLPESFDGTRIAFISDTHLGSFNDSLDVKKGIDLMMSEHPDIIFFGGDLVNNQSEEAEAMLCELKRMDAPLGMFSVLGNHDVGDYRRWKTIEEKNANLELLKLVETKAGFKLLVDENFILKKDNDSIAIIGVNSWGRPPFKGYGNLGKAMTGIENVPFKILLTHNPVHWDEEVAGKNDIELSLSGHTHAMQFGFDCCNIFWSPVEYIYKHWAGLYNEGEQYLYVNRGFGYLGFPGRIGMTPEITIIELKKK